MDREGGGKSGNKALNFLLFDVLQYLHSVSFGKKEIYLELTVFQAARIKPFFCVPRAAFGSLLGSETFSFDEDSS